jgi:hypothetical protein
MGEPLGVVLVVTACLLALRSDDGQERERRIGVAFASLAISVILLKEMLVVTLMLPLVLLFAENERYPLASPRRRRRTLLVSMIAAVPIASIPVMFTAASAPRGAYAADFGTQIRSLPDAVAQWTLAILPFDPGASVPPRLSGLALVTFTTIIVVGWSVYLRRLNETFRFAPRKLLAIALLFPMAGTLSYLPWPSWNRFYSLPFLLGGAILAAVAFQAIEAWSRRAFLAASAVWGMLLVSAAADASGQANRLAARQLANRAVVSRLAELRGSFDTVFVATDQHVPAAWQGLGPTLERYGKAFGLDMPAVVNLPCDKSRELTSTQRVAVAAYGSHCPGFAGDRPIVVQYRRLSLFELRVMADSLRVDFMVPSSLEGARVP